MGIPDPALEQYLISNAQSRSADLITAFSAEQPSDAAAMSARIGTVLDGYCAALLDDLRRAVGQIDAAEAAWLRQHYLRLIVEFATNVRDSIADAASRHAAAQIVQCKVLEHERNLRMAMDTHGGLTPTLGVENSSPPTPTAANN
jgi:hypothetical protein